ncbi:MAG: hypothetical protein ACXABY_37350 [Candidatus Thorarchaeota archaeon]
MKHRFKIEPNRYAIGYDILVNGEVKLTEVELETALEMVKRARQVERVKEIAERVREVKKKIERARQDKAS